MGWRNSITLSVQYYHFNYNVQHLLLKQNKKVPSGGHSKEVDGKYQCMQKKSSPLNCILPFAPKTASWPKSFWFLVSSHNQPPGKCHFALKHFPSGETNQEKMEKLQL